MIISTVVLSRGEGGFDNDGARDFNNNDFHNLDNDNGYNNNFYYDNRVNDNGVVIVPDDSSDCQSTQVCDASGNCVTQQSCN